MTSQCNIIMVLQLFSGQYFSIKEQSTDKALDATNGGNIVLWDNHGSENQLWSWKDIEETTLVNKMHEDRELKFIFNFGGV